MKQLLLLLLPFAFRSFTMLLLSCLTRCQVQGGTFVPAAFVITLILTVGLALGPYFHTSDVLVAQSPTFQLHAEVRAMLQHCPHVYVDCGTNVGIQIRKLYEPELFSKASILPHFKKYFGSADQRRQHVCSFGFEPNGNHSANLRKVEHAYNDMGWRTRMFVETAIGPKPTTMYLRPDPDVANMQWSASMVDKGAGEPIPVVGIVDFFRHGLAWGGVTSKHIIVMKIDVEGMDAALLAALAFSGQLCRVSFVYVEHVTASAATELSNLLKESGCDTVVARIDDESYHNKVNIPLPTPTHV